MVGGIITRIKRFYARMQQAEYEHFLVNRLESMRRKDPCNLSVDPESLLPIRIENGKLNEEGQRVIQNALAEFLRKKSLEGSRVSFGVYLEKAKEVLKKLELNDLQTLGILGDRYKGKTCFESGDS